MGLSICRAIHPGARGTTVSDQGRGPGHHLARVLRAGLDSTLHGVVFAIFCPGPAVHRRRGAMPGADTRSLALALTGRIDPTPTHHALGWLACLALGRLHPHPQLAATALLDVEGAGLAHEIAELVVAVGAHVEVGEEIGDLPADLTEQHPAIFAFDL